MVTANVLFHSMQPVGQSQNNKEYWKGEKQLSVCFKHLNQVESNRIQSFGLWHIKVHGSRKHFNLETFELVEASPSSKHLVIVTILI